VGDLTARRAIDLDLVDYIAAVTGRSVGSVKRKLTLSDARTRVRNIFDEYYDAAVLGAMSVRFVLDHAIESGIARLVGMSERRVRNRLQSMHGKTKVSTAFAREWG
jgi:hypothetical protein